MKLLIACLFIILVCNVAIYVPKIWPSKPKVAIAISVPLTPLYQTSQEINSLLDNGYKLCYSYMDTCGNFVMRFEK